MSNEDYEDGEHQDGRKARGLRELTAAQRRRLLDQDALAKRHEERHKAAQAKLIELMITLINDGGVRRDSIASALEVHPTTVSNRIDAHRSPKNAAFRARALARTEAQ